MGKTKGSGTNPLSDARKSIQEGESKTKRKRRKAGDDGSRATTKADLKASELWHRKSGAGYQLFVEYYAKQPKGIVVVDSSEDDILRQNELLCTFKDSSEKKRAQGKGLSRAAKRKRRKKGKPSLELHDKESDEPIISSLSALVEGDRDMKNCSFALSPQFKSILEQNPEYKSISRFLHTMSNPLPLTLRIRHPSFLNLEDKQLRAKEIKLQLKENFSNIIDSAKYDKTKKTIYQALPKTNLNKFSLGKICPELKDLVGDATAQGIMARQELGSMLPVMALAGVEQLKYGVRVLDMCASPGSKTLQALEIVATPPSEESTLKKGKIIANDVHPMCLDSLKDAVKRSGMVSSLTNRIRYTNYDASKYPTPPRAFDCIIADVPCSGDGTVRKDSHILPNWMPSISNSLHALQLSILKRAIKLLKVGGVVAYSTCSLNPIEDEAVVASALLWGNRFDEKCVELLDLPDSALLDIRCRSGVDNWLVADYKTKKIDSTCSTDVENMEDVTKLQWYEDFQSADDDNMAHVSKTMWPPEKKPREFKFRKMYPFTSAR